MFWALLNLFDGAAQVRDDAGVGLQVIDCSLVLVCSCFFQGFGIVRKLCDLLTMRR